MNALKITGTDAEQLRVANYIVLFDKRDLEGIGTRDRLGRGSQDINKDGSLGQYFTKNTILESPYTQTGQLVIDFDHGMDPDQHDPDDRARGPSRDDILGYVDWKTAKIEDKGIWVERVLNRRLAYVRFLEDLIEQGLIGTSTEPIQDGIEIGIDGEIKSWPLKRDSMTVTPMEPLMISDNALSALKGLSEHFPGLKSIIQSGPGNPGQDQDQEPEKENIEMSDKQDAPDMNAFKVEILEGVKGFVSEALTQQNEQIEGKISAAFEANKPPINNAGIDVPNVAKHSDLWKYDHLDPGSHALALQVLAAAHGADPRRVQPGSEAMAKSLAVKLINDKTNDHNGNPKHSQTKSAMQHMFDIVVTEKAILQAKADELNYSTQSGFGDEWIGVAYASELWPRIIQDTPVVSMVPEMAFPAGAESVVIPLDGSPPTFYKVAQATAQDSNPGPVTRTVTTSKQATASQTMTLDKLGAAVDWTGELSEDAVVMFADELRRNIQQEASEVLEHVVIDGDTATGATTNINDIAGTPGGSEAFLTANGFRKLALVTNTANSRDGGALAVTDFLETIKLMGLQGRNALRKDRVAFILDLATHWKALELTQLATQDVFSAPTIENGFLANIYGYNVVASANMHRANQDATYGLKANSAGKIDLDTAANNTTGSILAVRWDQWRLGYRRNLTFEVERVPRADSWEITALLRFGLIYRDTEASAISYNLTV